MDQHLAYRYYLYYIAHFYFLQKKKRAEGRKKKDVKYKELSERYVFVEVQTGNIIV